MEELLATILTQIERITIGALPETARSVIPVVAKLAKLALRARDGKITVPKAEAEIERLVGKFAANDREADEYAKAKLKPR